jgi:hypothetical protein
MLNNLLEVKKIFLYKLDFSELKTVDCKLPIEIERINTKNISKVLNFRDTNTENCFKNMLRSDEIGVYGMLNNKAVGHAWCAMSKNNVKKEVGSFFKTKSEIAYLHFVNVKKDFRGNDICPYLVYNLFKTVNENYDIDIIYTDIEHNNLSSQNVVKKLGFKLYKKYTFIDILGHTVNRRTLK